MRPPLRHSQLARLWRMAAVCLGAFVAATGAMPSDTSGTVDGGVSPPESAVPWVAVHSIWFFSNRTEIDELETAKFVALAAWVGTHAGSEVGIGFSTDAIDPESARARTTQLRISAIRDAMVAVGIPEGRIHVGSYGLDSPAVDRRIVIFARTGLVAPEPFVVE